MAVQRLARNQVPHWTLLASPHRPRVQQGVFREAASAAFKNNTETAVVPTETGGLLSVQGRFDCPTSLPQFRLPYAKTAQATCGAPYLCRRFSVVRTWTWWYMQVQPPHEYATVLQSSQAPKHFWPCFSLKCHFQKVTNHMVSLMLKVSEWRHH